MNTQKLLYWAIENEVGTCEGEYDDEETDLYEQCSCGRNRWDRCWNNIPERAKGLYFALTAPVAESEPIFSYVSVTDPKYECFRLSDVSTIPTDKLSRAAALANEINTIAATDPHKRLKVSGDEKSTIRKDGDEEEYETYTADDAEFVSLINF